MILKNINVILLTLLLFYSCKNVDTTPPTVTISSHYSGQEVGEIVKIIVKTDDNEGISKVELFINDSLAMVLMDEPYEFNWNTTITNDGDYIIKVIAWDTSDNSTESQPILLIVNNKPFYPSTINIDSIVYDNSGFIIKWFKSIDPDFESYTLEKSSESNMSNFEEVHVTASIDDTTFFDINVNPISYYYYRIMVRDTSGLEMKGDVFSSSLDPVPESVDVIAVTYNISEMTVEWGKSTDEDLKHYKLYYSETVNGDKAVAGIFTDINTTSFNTNDFDPTHENWYWVEVEDVLGQVSQFGQGMTNDIDLPPTVSEITQILYQNDSFIISWEKSGDNDFHSYRLYESDAEDMSSPNLIYESDNVDNNTFTVLGIYDGTKRFYKLYVEDVWGLTSESRTQTGSTYNLFVKTFGGVNSDGGSSIIKTDDGSYIIAGGTSSQGAGDNDIWLVKIDSNGNLIWENTIGSVDSEWASCIHQTTDGGFIILGNEIAFDGGYLPTKWNKLLIKTNFEGTKEWQKSYYDGEAHWDDWVISTNDGGYFLSGTKLTNIAYQKRLIKTDSWGNTIWDTIIDSSMGGSIIQSQNTDLIATFDKWNNDSGWDVALISFDLEGNKRWEKYFGGTGRQGSNFIHQTIDEGFVIVGYTSDGNDSDMVLLKTDSNGNEIWYKTYENNNSERGYFIHQTIDGGFVIVGTSDNGNDTDIILIKTDSIGNILWEKTFGGDQDDSGSSVLQTEDGGYLIVGNTKSFGNGESDMWLIKTDAQGNTVQYK